MAKFILYWLLAIFPIYVMAQKTKLKEVYFYKSKQLKQVYWVLKKNKNIRSGWYKSFYENGVLKEEGKYEQNLKTGKWREFNTEGILNRIKDYKKGKKLIDKKVGVWIKSYESGQVIKRYDYDTGQALETLFSVFIKYPNSARDNNIQGVVKIGLILDLDCNIEKISIVKSLSGDCDESALVSIRKMAELIKKYDQTKCTEIERIISVHFRLD